MYLFTHLVSLIQPSLNTLNVSLKEKQMPYLDTKTRFVLVRTTNEWCRVALWHTLLTALEKHLESMKKESLIHEEYGNQHLPPFLIHKTKVRLPKLNVVS